jgi:hypothetical protein
MARKQFKSSSEARRHADEVTVAYDKARGKRAALHSPKTIFKARDVHFFISSARGACLGCLGFLDFRQ